MTRRFRLSVSGRGLRRLIVAAAFVACVGLLMLWLAGVLRPRVGHPAAATQSDGSPVPPGAAVVPVRSVLVPVNETASGTIESVYESDVAAKLLAKVIEVRISAGQAVARDEPLVLLDDADLRARVGQAEALVAQTSASLDQARMENRHLEQAAAAQAATALELERSRTRVKEAEAALERARRALDEAQTVLDYTVIRSPMDGIVIDKRVQPGDTVSPGQVVATVYDPTRMQLVASLQESLATGLRVGRPIRVHVDALDYTCEGTVSEIVPEAQAGSRTFEVKVTGPCPQGVYAGMFGRLILPLGEQRLLVIPQAAVRRIGQLDVVDVVHDAATSRRVVRLGRAIGGDVEVLSGLREGETVVVPDGRGP